MMGEALPKLCQTRIDERGALHPWEVLVDTDRAPLAERPVELMLEQVLARVASPRRNAAYLKPIVRIEEHEILRSERAPHFLEIPLAQIRIVAQ
jgi:hypothetical protein